MVSSDSMLLEPMVNCLKSVISRSNQAVDLLVRQMLAVSSMSWVRDLAAWSAVFLITCHCRAHTFIQVAFEFFESTLSQTNGEINHMVCWSGSIIVPASWSSMVVFDRIFA